MNLCCVRICLTRYKDLISEKKRRSELVVIHQTSQAGQATRLRSGNLLLIVRHEETALVGNVLDVHTGEWMGKVFFY